MVMTYKIGDTVRIVSNKSCSSNYIGDVGVITALSANECRVHVEGGSIHCNWSIYEDLELVTETKSTAETYIAILVGMLTEEQVKAAKRILEQIEASKLS